MIDIEEAIDQHDITITLSDARTCFGGCIPGWQAFAAKHNLDYKYIVRHGMLASQLYKTNDAMAIQLVRFVYDRK